jgi:hypothetical protein
MLEDYRERVKGTTIDPTTLLSTDYFNHFNEVIMLLGMLPDMPELLEDVDAWVFKSYAEHFQESGLGFKALAVEAYDHAPPATLEAFEATVAAIRTMIAEAVETLHLMAAAGQGDAFADRARFYARELGGLIDTASSIVHGTHAPLDQTAIDDLF